MFYAGRRGTALPTLTACQILVCACHQAVSARVVSASPLVVTVQRVADFEAVGASIKQLTSTGEAVVKLARQIATC